MSSKDYYQLLGVAPDASATEIKRAFRQLSLKYHPDKTDDKLHHELFLKVNEAYEILSSPESKRQYDVTIGAGSSININIHGYSPSKPSAGHGNSYYGFYQTYYKRPDESFKQAEAEKRRFEQEKRQAFERARAEDALRRKAEIREAQLRQAKQQHEAAKRQKYEQEKLREQERRQEEERIMEQRRRKEQVREQERERIREHIKAQEQVRMNINRSNEAYNFQYKYNQDDGQDYHQEKQRAYANSNSKPNIEMEDKLDQQYRQTMNFEESGDEEEYDTDEQGRNSSDPIVVDDDNPDSNGNTYVDGIADQDVDANHNDNADNDDENVDTFYSTKADTSGHDDYQNEASQNIPANSESNQTPHTPSNMDNHSDGVDENGINVSLDEEEEPSINQNKSKQEVDYRAGILDDIDSPVNLRPKQMPNYMRNRRPTSPNRMTKMKQTNNPVHTKDNGKRAKMGSFVLNDLQNSLATNLEDVDFHDMFESLPKDGRRKPSVHLSNAPKRPRVAEFSDGTSKLETLHTPINRNSIKGHAPKLTKADLYAINNITLYKPPVPPEVVIEGSVDENGWQRYVINIENYGKDFLQYRKHMVQYLSRRAQADEEYFIRINGNPENFKVYQECLDQDLRLQEGFTEQLRKFTTTMQVYQQNRNWMDRAASKRSLGL